MNDTYKNIYDSNGNLAKTTSNNDTYKYTYDLAKLLREYRFNNFKVKYNYDKNNNISNKSYLLNNLNQNINYTYNDDNSIIKTELDNNEVNYTYDYLGRITNRNINNSYNTDYTYITNGKRTSLLVKTLKNNNDIYKYKYDKLNNITHIYLNDNLINRYYYDNYNELIKEHDYQNNQTIEYTYDNYGNLLSKKTYELNTTTLVSENTYEYSNTNWVDQLTKFNNDSITYDEIGNPLTIGSKTLTWINGRQLNSYNDGTNNITYKYDKDGIRKSKTINNVTTNYYLEGNDIVFEEINNNMIYYIRDISGLTGFKYNDNIYYYVKNLQNDIIGILDSNYQEIAKYKYDSWGNILSILDNNGNDISNDITHIANINPYRYRSYYYDKETGLYYLNSRYYNPKWGRFLSVDNYIGDFGTLSGYNLYQYSVNNPISFKDEIGMWPKISFKTIVNAIKLIVLAVKTIKKLNITRKKEKPKVSFVIEVGNGTGNAGELQAFNTEVKFADYIDDTMKYQNNKIECYTESVKSLSIINGYEIKKIQNYDCETRELIGETKTVETYSTPIANYSEGKLTTFLGLEGNLHIISGGHIKIGYEIEW